MATPDPARFYTAEVVERVDFSEDLALMKMRPTGPDDVIRFKPGQYATVGMLPPDATPDTRLIERPYSIVSSPHEDVFEFFVELVPEGALTPVIWTLKVGDTVHIRRRIVGRFVLDVSTPSRDQHIMLATVTGIAPFLSMVRKQAHDLATGALGAPQRMHILHGASHAKEFGSYQAECERLAAEHDWLAYVATVSRPWDEPEWTGETGRVDDVVRKWFDRWGLDPARTVGYACGHPDMITNTAGILRRARLTDDQIKEEKYF